MNTLISLIILLVIAIICTFIHTSKGYSPITGFLWGFFFHVIGLIVVLLEKNKSEHDVQNANKQELSMSQWLLIFLGIGVSALVILFLLLHIF